MEYSAVTHPLPLPRKKSGNRFFDGRRAEHARVAGFDQHGAFRGEQVFRRYFQRPELVGFSLIDTHSWFLYCAAIYPDFMTK